MREVSILVIDSERGHRDCLTESLRAEGYKVIAPGDARLAKTLLSESAPDIIIMDDFVNGLTSEDILEELRTQNLDAFVIIMTPAGDLDRSMQYIINGAFACFTKPVQYEKIKPAIEKGLENKRALHEILNLSVDLNEANVQLNRHRSLLVQNQTALHDKTEQLRFLNRFSAELSKTLDSRKVLESTSTAVSLLLKATLTVIMSGLPLEKQPAFFASQPLTSQTGEFLAARLRDEMRTGAVGACREAKLFEFDDEPSPLVNDAARHLVLPLVAADQDCGLLAIFLPSETRPDSDLKMLLESLAMQAAQALFNAYQHEQALEKANRDPLTGLYNRRIFEENLTREFKRSLRHRTALSLLMIDLDFFKSVNDRFGHQVGDEVLKTMGRLLAGCSRETDLLARYGGEEFVFILPDTDQSQAVLLAERIQKKVNQTVFISGKEPLKQTISQGVADTGSLKVNAPEDLLFLADQALYQAKKDGRNTIRAGHEAELRERKDMVNYA